MCRSTHDWNEIYTYEKFKKKCRNRSWFSWSCRFSFKKRFFVKFECCTFSLFVRFSVTTSLFDTCSRIKNRRWSTNSQSYKIIVYETFSNRFESFQFRFWKFETHVVFIDLHLNQLQIQIKYRVRIANRSNIIYKECRLITNKLSNDFKIFEYINSFRANWSMNKSYNSWSIKKHHR
jgi:hypothetical protein